MFRFRKQKTAPHYHNFRWYLLAYARRFGREETIRVLRAWIMTLEDDNHPLSKTLDLHREVGLAE